jgi:hypothetical protein
VQVFLKPIKSQKLMTPLEMAALFSNVLYIINISEELSAGLLLLLDRDPHELRVGSLFLSLVCVRRTEWIACS